MDQTHGISTETILPGDSFHNHGEASHLEVFSDLELMTKQLPLLQKEERGHNP
jgi:hypothetical protein